ALRGHLSPAGSREPRGAEAIFARPSRSALATRCDTSVAISSDPRLFDHRKQAGPLQVGRALRAFRQRSAANRHDRRIFTQPNLVVDGPANVLHQRLEVVFGETRWACA